MTLMFFFSSWEGNINIKSAHLLLPQDADLMYYAYEMVYMSITGLHVTRRLFICTLEACGRDCGF